MNQPSDINLSLRRTQTVCLVILTVIAVGVALYYLQTVLLPFVIALFLVSGCRPILDFLEKRLGLHWFGAFVVTFLFGVVLLMIFGFLIWISINDLSRNSDMYLERISGIRTSIQELIADPKETNQIQPELQGPEGTEPVDNETDSKGENLLVQPKQAVRDLVGAIPTYAQNLVVNLVGLLTSLLSYGVLILIFAFFLLLGRSEGQAHRPPIIGDMDDQIRKYIVMKTTISALTGMATTLVLYLFGVPLAVVFGMFAFLLNFIPNIGPLIANMLPVPFLILNPAMSPWAAVVCFVLISAIQFISGNVVETRVMGKSFDVAPVVLLLALMFFGLIWGIVGMFLATPIASVIKIVLQQHRETKPIAELMAGRWTSGAEPDQPGVA